MACRFCAAEVVIPEEVRQRVEAAATLASARRSGLARLERLLVSQPSASFANVTMWLAALPILLAWPIAGGLVLWDAFHSTLTLARSAALFALPLLLTFGAFLLARGRLTDRFALHAVVVGFGARDPFRPGEPYRCRACDAALPDVKGSPVVHCLFCNQANVLGLDLRGDAREASEETQSLESAFAARGRERWLWRVASLASIGLLVAALFIVRSSLRGPPNAVAFRDVTRRASLITQTGGVPANMELNLPLSVGFAPAKHVGSNCRAWLKMGDRVVYNREGICDMEADSPVRYDDPDPTSKDGDSRFQVDLPARTASFGDGTGGRVWEAKLRLP